MAPRRHANGGHGGGGGGGGLLENGGVGGGGGGVGGVGGGGGGGGGIGTNDPMDNLLGPSQTTRCCTPTGECLRGDTLIRLNALHDAVKVTCNNDNCPVGQFMHRECFDAWEQTVLTYLKSCGRARSWSERQRHQNLWTKKGYDLAFKACGCRCGRGHLKKDLDWMPPGLGNVPGNRAEENEAKKKKRRNRQNTRPSLAVSAGPPNHGNHVVAANGRGTSEAQMIEAGRGRAGSLSSSTGSSSPPATSEPSVSPLHQPQAIMKKKSKVDFFSDRARQSCGANGIFSRRLDFSAFNSLPRTKLNSYHIKVRKPCMGGFSLGCGLGWSAPCVEILRSQLDDFAINLIASVFPIGAALGTLAVPFLVDRIGRKWTMMVLVPVFVSGWILLVCAGTMVPLFVTGRIVTGACGGMCCVLAPMYSAEISEKRIRGTTGVFFQLLLVLGILYVYCTGFTRDVIAISSLCCLAPIVFGVTLAFMPESPLFYMTKNKEEDARKSMRFFRGPDFDIEPEMNAFKEQVERSKYQRGPSISAFMNKSVLKTLAVAYGLMFAQQFSGINAIIFYGLTILESTGVGMESQLELVIFGVVQVVACVAAALLIDKLGRKILMVISMATMCVCLSALAGFFVLKSYQPEQADRMHWLPLTSVCVYILAFCFGAGPIPWAYMGEIFPTRLKGAASSSAALFNWLLAFTVTISFPSAVEVLDSAMVFSFFAILCALSTLFVIFFMVETKDKTFTEIEEAYGTHMEDEGNHGNDDTRCFILSTLAALQWSRVTCVLCRAAMLVFDRYPLVDGTFFLSPRQHSHACAEVKVEGRTQYLSAVCMSCLEGSGGQPVRCRFCTQPWDGSSLVLGTMYSYDIFAAMPCCSERLKCNSCQKPLIYPHQRLNFYSDYSRVFGCPHCRSVDAHFVKPLSACFTREQFQLYSQWP